MFLDLPGQSDATNRQISARSVDWCPQNGLGGSGTYLTPNFILERILLGPLFLVPLVLLLGNHSSGKSSFINHLIGQKVQRTGAAPCDDGFTVIMDTATAGGDATEKPGV